LQEEAACLTEGRKISFGHRDLFAFPQRITVRFGTSRNVRAQGAGLYLSSIATGNTAGLTQI
jgi:hypothetical protein